MADRPSDHSLYKGQFRYLPASPGNATADDRNTRSRERALGRELSQKLRYVGGHMLPYIDVDIQSKREESPATGHSWKREDVSSVVDRYLKAADHYHITPGFADTTCQCCVERNNENAERRYKQFIREGQSEREKSAEAREAPLLEDGVGMYRSETPDLTLRTGDKDDPEGTPYYHNNMTLPEYTYSYKDYVDTTDPRSARVAESVLDATSRYKRSMGKLNRTIENIERDNSGWLE